MPKASSKPTRSGVGKQILDEHRRIRDINRTMQSASTLAALLPCLAELKAVLPEHFHTEEGSDGFFAAVREAAPQYQHLVDRLEHEHAVLLADLDLLADRASACRAEIAAILTDARALGHRLGEHESAENQLLLDSAYSDLGQEGD